MSSIEHHRTKEFKSVFAEAQKGLQYVFETKQPVLMLSSTGTGAMEAAISNLFSRGDLVLAINAGKFGERWIELGKHFCLEVLCLDVPWGHAVQVQQVEDVVKKYAPLRGVLIQAVETSTGVEHPIRDIGLMLAKKSPHALYVVDAISALLTMPLKMDAWNIDALIAGSQKGFGLPPGLAFIALSEKAWAAAEKSSIPKYYFDLKKEKKAHNETTTAYTTPVTLVEGLKKSLEAIQQEGLENIHKRYALFYDVVRQCVQDFGLKLYPIDPSKAVVAVYSPSSVASSVIISKMKQKYDPKEVIQSDWYRHYKAMLA